MAAAEEAAVGRGLLASIKERTGNVRPAWVDARVFREEGELICTQAMNFWLLARDLRVKTVARNRELFDPYIATLDRAIIIAGECRTRENFWTWLFNNKRDVSFRLNNILSAMTGYHTALINLRKEARCCVSLEAVTAFVLACTSCLVALTNCWNPFLAIFQPNGCLENLRHLFWPPVNNYQPLPATGSSSNPSILIFPPSAGRFRYFDSFADVSYVRRPDESSAARPLARLGAVAFVTEEDEEVEKDIEQFVKEQKMTLEEVAEWREELRSDPNKGRKEQHMLKVLTRLHNYNCML